MPFMICSSLLPLYYLTVFTCSILFCFCNNSPIFFCPIL